MLKSSFKSFNSKQKTQREKKDKTLVLPKKQVENIDLHKPALNQLKNAQE